MGIPTSDVDEIYVQEVVQRIITCLTAYIGEMEAVSHTRLSYASGAFGVFVEEADPGLGGHGWVRPGVRRPFLTTIQPRSLDDPIDLARSHNANSLNATEPTSKAKYSGRIA